MTTNEMILKTISTKLTKEPIYKSILEDLGYEVYDSKWSAYNNWAIKNKKTGNTVLFSKGYDNKKRLYDTSRPINARNFKEVDYVGLLKKEKRPRFSNTNTSEYAILRDKIKESKWSIEYYKKDIEGKRKRLDEIMNDIKRYEGYISNSEACLGSARERVAELRNR